jgi:uncharacterized membrane protein YhiD involved in acid resistance
MNFESRLEEMLQNLDDFESEVNSSSDKSTLTNWIREIDELNKEVALKNECTKIYSKNFEKDAEVVEEEIQTHLMAQDRLKNMCKELKNEIKEIESIKEKTVQNHNERMKSITKNYNEVE